MEKQITSCECGLTQLAFRLVLTLLLKMRDRRKVLVNRADKQMVRLRLTPKRRMKQEKYVGFMTSGNVTR